MQSDNFKHNIYLPARLTEQLSKIPYFPVTVVEAPSGFGKTTAVKEYLNNALPDGARQYWYTCLSENSLMAWSGICDMFSKINKELGSNLEKLGFPTLDSLIYITTAFKDINCDNESYIVIDNYQIIKSDILQELISVFSMHGCPSLHLIFITQSLGKKAQFIFHNNNIHKIDSSYFLFDKESTAVLLKMEGIRLSDNELNSVYASTEGWISALRLQISSYKQSGSFDYIADIDHLVEHAIWNRLTDEERTCLVSLSVMDSFTARQAAIMLEEEMLPDQIREMLKTNDFIRYYPREKIYVIHSILQNYLRNQFYQYQSETFQKNVLHKAGKCCVAEADFGNAIKFFYEVGDFDSILSVPFNGIYLTNRRENNIMELIIKVISDCPDDILCKYPFVLLMLSYLLLFEGQLPEYNKLCRLISFILEQNPSGISKEQIQQIKGEYYLLKSFAIYNDIKRAHEEQKAAFKLLGAGSRYRLNEIPFTMGGTSVLNMFWREPGRLDETLADMKEYLPLHIRLTNGQGVGADSVLHAEMMLMRGDDSHAEILCHRALYQARSKQEICICLCAEQILARIAILRGDVEGFITAIENIKSYAKESSNLYILRMVDICLSVISVSLDTTDMVAKWFCDMESIKKKVYARAVPYVSILYSHLLVREKHYAEFLGLADEMISMSEEMNYVFPRLYSLIFKARAYYFRGSEGKALKNLEEAFALAFPDKIYLPFAQFSYMDDMLAKIRTGIGQQLKALPDSKDMKEQISSPEASAAPAKWKKDIDNVMELYKRYHKGREIILNAMQQKKSPLTPREREVALLAQNRLSHQEIAEKLCISKATVRTILHNAYNKLGIHSRTELYKIDL